MDKELLELAAKAAGISFIDWRESWADYNGPAWRTADKKLWNPITDDGDALRLAVKLGISPVFLYSQLEGGFKRGVSARHMEIYCEEWSADIGASTRFAITGAAAEIGRKMP